MDKREKVVEGLRTVVHEMQAEVEEWKDYSDSELASGITVDCDWWLDAAKKCEDALELLKAQQPRVMSAEEIETADRYCEDYKAFLDAAKTEREAVDYAVAQNILVIKTLPGLANAACTALDNMEISNLVGSIAGDDTAFLAMKDNASAEHFFKEIASLL